MSLSKSHPKCLNANTTIFLTRKVVRFFPQGRLSAMMSAMMSDESSSIRTRPSLLGRLKDGNDSQSWDEFYRIYGKLVRDFALQAGLSTMEADEVVQETV